MSILPAFLTILGSFFILRVYGLDVQKDDFYGLKDPRTLIFSVLNILDVISTLPSNYRRLGFGDALMEVVTSVCSALIGAAILLWIVYGIMTLLGGKPNEGEDAEAFKIRRKTSAFWWNIAISVIFAMYMFSVGEYRF